MKLSLCSFEGHKIYMLITDNNIFIGLQVDNEPVVFPDVEEAKKFIKTLGGEDRMKGPWKVTSKVIGDCKKYAVYRRAGCQYKEV